MNYLFQRFVTRTQDLTDNGFEHKVRQCSKHVYNYRSSVRGSTNEPRVFELGTGWETIVPIGIWLCGAAVVFSLDLVNHLTHSKVMKVIKKFIDFEADGRLLQLLPDAQAGKIDILKTIYRERDSIPTDILREVGIVTFVGDARQIPLDSSSIDLIASNNTLEHIPEQSLGMLFKEFGRIASPRATMSHFIDMADHYASFDHSITPYNFYAFSERRWSAFNNKLHYQNRLRISDYRLMHMVGGFSIKGDETTKGSPDQLEGLQLTSTFLRYSREDLLATEAWLTSVPESSLGRASITSVDEIIR